MDSPATDRLRHTQTRPTALLNSARLLRRTGLLTVLITPSVAQLLRYFDDQYIALVVLASFLAIGVLAERKRYM